MTDKMAFLTKNGLELFWNNIRKILVPVFICSTEGNEEIKEIEVDSGFKIRKGTQMIVNFLNKNESPFPKIAVRYSPQPDSSEASVPSTPSGSGSNEVEADDYPSTGENIEEYPQHESNTNTDNNENLEEEAAEEANGFTLMSLQGPLSSESGNNNEEDESIPTEGADSSVNAVPVYEIDRPKAGYLSGFCHFIYYDNKWHLVSSEAATMRTIHYTEPNYPAPSTVLANVGDIWLKRKEIIT